MITETVAKGMAALLQSYVEVEVRDAERELFSIDYVPPYGVLDEGEGLSVKRFYLRYVLLDSFVWLGCAPLGGCDGVEVAALSRRRPPMHVGMRWCRGSRSVSASSTHARNLDLRFVALVGVAAVGTCWCSRERWR